MKVGITGTKNGASPSQLAAIASMLYVLDPEELHHGDCVGVDAQAHTIAEKLQIRTVLHPPTDDKLRAFCLADEDCPPRPYLKRNHDIVDSVDHMIVVPEDGRERFRGSGTWATFRYTKKTGKPFTLLLP